MNHIVMHCPDKGLDQFEEISYLIKMKDEMRMDEFLRLVEKWEYNSQSTYFTQVVNDYAQHAKKLFDVSSNPLFKFVVTSISFINLIYRTSSRQLRIRMTMMEQPLQTWHQQAMCQTCSMTQRSSSMLVWDSGIVNHYC